MNGATEDAGPSRKDWAIAYASQARSDWELYETLQERGEPRCHQLHYLQMASEKIAKAYRFRDTSTSEDSLLTQHVGFIKFLNAFLKSDRVKQMYKDKTRQLREVSKRFGNWRVKSKSSRRPSMLASARPIPSIRGSKVARLSRRAITNFPTSRCLMPQQAGPSSSS